MQPRSISAACLVLHAWALLACEGDVLAPSGSGGGDGSGGAGPTSGVVATTTIAASSVVASGVSSAAQTSTSSGPDCPTVLIQDAELNAFANEHCCAEMFRCDEPDDACLVEDTDALDTSTLEGAALYECLYIAGWYGARVCDSGFEYEYEGDDPVVYEVVLCIEQTCCAEFTACTDGGADIEGCVECLDRADPFDDDRCEAANECVASTCEYVFPSSHEICESELSSVHFFDDSACIEENCCDAFEACTNGGESEASVDACLACLASGGGPLCDAALTCRHDTCNPTAICDAGISYPDLELAQCLTDNCCDAYRFCTDDGGDADACITCLGGDDGGPLCDDAIACFDAFCSGM